MSDRVLKAIEFINNKEIANIHYINPHSMWFDTKKPVDFGDGILFDHITCTTLTEEQVLSLAKDCQWK